MGTIGHEVNGSETGARARPAGTWRRTIELDINFLHGIAVALPHMQWPVEKIRPGDFVTVGPNQKNWHGAAPTTAMTLVTSQESLEGKVVEWLEKVTDGQYQGPCEGASRTNERKAP